MSAPIYYTDTHTLFFFCTYTHTHTHVSSPHLSQLMSYIFLWLSASSVLPPSFSFSLCVTLSTPFASSPPTCRHLSFCSFSTAVLFHLAVTTNSPPLCFLSPLSLRISACQHPSSLCSLHLSFTRLSSSPAGNNELHLLFPVIITSVCLHLSSPPVEPLFALDIEETYSSLKVELHSFYTSASVYLPRRRLLSV